jgi:glycosyltransferase involved in cell wall biosynthesis
MKRPPAPFLVIVDASIGRTGAFVCAQNMARALQGHMPALLVVPREAQFSSSELAPFVGCERLALRAATRALPAALAWLVALIPSGLRLRKLLARTKATHLVLNDFYLLQGVICRLLGFRGQIISWVRVEPKRAGGRFTGVLWRLIGLSSNRVVAVSHFVQEQIPTGLRSVVIYDTLFSKPIPQAQEPRYGRIVYLGNIMPGKGQNHAIEAFASIAADYPDAVLEFYGGSLGVIANEQFQQQLQRRCKGLGLEGRVSFHGLYSDPFVILNNAYIALNFSESETFSFTVLEALSAGVPVISTDCGGPAEIIKDQITGILVPAGDHAAMARAMSRLLDCQTDTAVMADAASHSVASQFTVKAYQDQLMSLLRV